MTINPFHVNCPSKIDVSHRLMQGQKPQRTRKNIMKIVSIIFQGGNHMKNKKKFPDSHLTKIHHQGL